MRQLGILLNVPFVPTGRGSWPAGGYVTKLDVHWRESMMKMGNSSALVEVVGEAALVGHVLELSHERRVEGEDIPVCLSEPEGRNVFLHNIV